MLFLYLQADFCMIGQHILNGKIGPGKVKTQGFCLFKAETIYCHSLCSGRGLHGKCFMKIEN